MDERIAAPSPSPSPRPSPTVTPVQGALNVETRDASLPVKLGLPDDPVPDSNRVQAAATVVAEVLDDFFNSAQQGTAALGTLGAIWLAQESPAAADALLTGVTWPENPVETATYDMTVHVEDEPTIAAVHVEIRRRDDTIVDLELVFDVTDDEPRLQLLGGGEAA